MNRIIYLYTTEAERSLNRFKVGQTDRHSMVRIMEQFSTSNSTPPIKISHWNVSENITDKKVHQKLHYHGINRVTANREWFTFPGGSSQAIEIITKILSDNE